MKKLLLKLYLIILVALPLILIILPANFFDSGQSICLSIIVLDRECYACGMTRAIQHLIHFDFISAYSFNKLSFFVLPLLIYFNVKEIIKTYYKIIIFNKKNL